MHKNCLNTFDEELAYVNGIYIVVGDSYINCGSKHVDR